MAINSTDALIDSVVMDADGVKLGKVGDIYFDNETDKPEWAAVTSGFLGGHVSLIPLVDVTQDGRALHAPYTKDQVKNAPHHDPGEELSVDDEAELFSYYGVPYSGKTVTADPAAAPTTPASPPAPTSQSAPGLAGDDAMTRSEEQVRVGTRRQEAGRVRLRKYVVTEKVTRTVPVSHEEVRVEREAITNAKAMAGAEIAEAEVEVTLHAEVPVVEKAVVPVERVRVATETVTDQKIIKTDVRKERIVEEDEPGVRTS